jgi:hypothetical protein
LTGWEGASETVVRDADPYGLQTAVKLFLQVLKYSSPELYSTGCFLKLVQYLQKDFPVASTAVQSFENSLELQVHAFLARRPEAFAKHATSKVKAATRVERL